MFVVFGVTTEKKKTYGLVLNPESPIASVLFDMNVQNTSLVSGSNFLEMFVSFDMKSQKSALIIW